MNRLRNKAIGIALEYQRVSVCLCESVELGRVVATVAVWPVDHSPMAAIMGAERDLSACEHDVVSCLRQAGRKLTGVQIRVALRRGGYDYGDSTIDHALSHLTRSGVLENMKDHRGYSIVE